MFSLVYISMDCWLHFPRLALGVLWAVISVVRTYNLPGQHCSIYVDSFVNFGHVITSQFVVNDDILKRHNEFVGQVNNVLCFFSKPKSSVIYKLVQSYCMSLYGCELWLLSNTHIEDLCISWRRCLRSLAIAVQNSLLFAAASK